MFADFVDYSDRRMSALPISFLGATSRRPMCSSNSGSYTLLSWTGSKSAAFYSLYLTLLVLLSPDRSWHVSAAVQTGDCTPLGALIANRFNRSPMNSLRMLRGDAEMHDMEHLIRTHHNCLLKADRIRFKKSRIDSNNNKNGWTALALASRQQAIKSSNDQQSAEHSSESSVEQQINHGGNDNQDTSRIQLESLVGSYRRSAGATALGSKSSPQYLRTQEQPARMFQPVRLPSLLPNSRVFVDSSDTSEERDSGDSSLVPN